MPKPILKYLALFALAFCCFLSTVSLYSWRSYNRFMLGADAIGTGGAYTGNASGPTALHYNPSGVVQLSKTSGTNRLIFCYEVFSSAEILDVFSWNVSFKFDAFPFIGLIYTTDKAVYGLSADTLFYSMPRGSDFTLRSLKFSWAYPLLDNLSIGAGVGPVIALENKGYGLSYIFNTGVLWKPLDIFQIGVSFQSAVDLSWTVSASGSVQTETYPYIIDLGVQYAFSETLYGFFGLDYTGIDSIRYILNGADYSPRFNDNNIFSRLHPHAGIQFLENNTGAHISLGLMMDSSYYDTGSVNQYLITAGFRAYGKNLIYRASLIDALLIGLFYPGNVRNERINVEFSFLL